MFRLKTLGSLVVEGVDGLLAGSAAQRRTLALLVLVAAARERGASREKLIGLLWTDTTDERARHAFAQTLYRLRQEFGPEAVEGVGSDALRLNAATFSVDFLEFEDLLARGELEAAAALFAGHFLEGFVLPGAPEFERWMEEERARLSAIHRGLLERLAGEATQSGALERAAEWWRWLAANDPLNSRVAARLVAARHAAGDRSGALQYARVHETLVRLELDAEPGAEFAAAVAAARADIGTNGPSAPEPSSTSPMASSQVMVADGPVRSSSAQSVFKPTSETLRIAIPRRAFRRGVLLVGVTVTALAAMAYARRNTAGTASTPVIAVGHIADYTGGDSTAVARVLPEMLTTNLSRVEGLVVVSRTRLRELMVPRSDQGPDASDFARAAQQAGAHLLLDGALYRRADGSLRLDLRSLDLQTGRVRRSYQADASDAFALADSATMRVASGLAVPPSSALRISDVTTTSLVAFRFYEEGLHALRQNDYNSAKRLFAAALATDSGFAMAAFGMFQATFDNEHLYAALKLANRATEREQLIIRSKWAVWMNDPSQVAVAETLAARYAAEPESHLLLADALFWRGDFAGALVAARQAFAMDSLSLRTSAPRCVACEALRVAVAAYVFLDSLTAAERVTREWLTRQPGSPQAWRALAGILAALDDTVGALAANERARSATAGAYSDWVWVTWLAIRTGDFEKADRVLAPLAQSRNRQQSQEALWRLAISQRHRGRLRAALATTERLEFFSPGRYFELLHRGQVLLEMGRYREAVARFDSAAGTAPAMRNSSSSLARHRTWALTHKAVAVAAAGDVAALGALADSVQSLGSRSGYGRDLRLHHHIRGLLFAAQGREEQALAAFRRAIWSSVGGYTRTNFELGRLLIELQRQHEAIPVLRAALHGGLEANNLYVTHTEIRALLSRAFKETRRSDSAATHRRWVERAMTGADAYARAHIDQLLGDSASTR